MVSIIIYTGLLVGVYGARWRCLQHLPHFSAGRRAVITLIAGVFSTSSLLGYDRFWSAISPTYNFAQVYTRSARIYRVISIGIISALIITVISPRLRSYGTLWVVPLICLLFGGSALGLISASTAQSTIIYFVFIACSEELLKRQTASAFTHTYQSSTHTIDTGDNTERDIILFALVAGAGFALIENIVYLFTTLPDYQSRITSIIAGQKLTLSRGLTTIPLHIMFTGLIAIIVWSYKKTLGPVSVILGITIGVGTHRAYNMMASSGRSLGVVIMVIGAYLGISYALFQSDRMYLPVLSTTTPIAVS